MSTLSDDLPPPRGLRWGWLILIVGLIQVALVVWLSDNRPASPRTPAPSPILRFSSPASAELRNLLNPTLFGLPNVDSFAGMAWMLAPRLEYRPYEYRESPQWLSPNPAWLGLPPMGIADTNPAMFSTIAPRPEPQFRTPAIPNQVLENPTTWRIEGGVASRTLLTPFSFTGFPHSDLLARTIVQLVVKPDGEPFSATILSSSGLKAADETALRAARAARFEPLPGYDPATSLMPAPQDLAWGRLVVDWQTLPLAPTNTGIPVVDPR